MKTGMMHGDSRFKPYLEPGFERPKEIVEILPRLVLSGCADPDIFIERANFVGDLAAEKRIGEIPQTQMSFFVHRRGLGGRLGPTATSFSSRIRARSAPNSGCESNQPFTVSRRSSGYQQSSSGKQMMSPLAKGRPTLRPRESPRPERRCRMSNSLCLVMTGTNRSSEFWSTRITSKFLYDCRSRLTNKRSNSATRFNVTTTRDIMLHQERAWAHRCAVLAFV